MKKLFASSTLLLCLLATTTAQFLPGISTSNYNGVLGTFQNPANVLGPYRLDVHLFGLNVLGANELSKVKLSDIGKDNFVNNKLIGESGYNNANVNLDVPLVSVLIGLSKKNSFAVTSRARVFANAGNIDAKLINAITEGDESDSKYPYTFSPSDPSLVNASAITEYGFTWANEILNKGAHYLRGGITAKYVSGIGNVSVNTAIDGMLNKDGDGEYISPGTGNINFRNGGDAFLDDFSVGNLYDFSGGGIGFDLGFTYEYRPISWNTASTELKAHGSIPYQFKFSASLMDIGKVKFTPDSSLSKSYAVHIPTNEKFYLSAFENTGIEDATEIFDAYPQYFTNTGVTTTSYKVSLPTTLHLNFDYNIGKGFFANFDAQLSMKTTNSIDNIRAYNIFSLTPRFEGKKMGVFLPISMNQVSGFNVGAALHLGGLYIGSGSILSLLTGGSKQADVFLGLRFGALKTKQPSHKNEPVLTPH